MRKLALLLAFAFSLFSLQWDQIFKNYGTQIRTLHWINNGAFVYLKEGKFYRYDVNSYSSVELSDLSRSFKEKFGKEFKLRFFSGEGELLIFPGKNKAYVYDTSTGKWTSFKVSPPFFLSPDRTMAAYSSDGNLTLTVLRTGEIRKLTKDATEEIFYGKTDWVYCEELELCRAIWWSPDSRKLLFLKFDESQVKSYPILDFIPLYGKIYHEKYPKAGENNPKVSIGFTDIFGKEITWISYQDEYIARAGWVDSDRIYFITLNRHQNRLRLWLYSISRKKKVLALEEKWSTWLNVTGNFTFYRNKLIWASERDGHMHLYLYKLKGLSMKLVRQITKGPWEVTRLYGTDGKRIYFQANLSSPPERGIYASSFRGKIRQLTPLGGTNSARFSPNFRYFVDFHSDLLVPPEVYIFKTGGRSRLIDRGKGVKELGLRLPEIRRVSLEGRDYYTLTIKPPDFSPDKQYPVIVYVYGGPHAQVVRRAWMGSFSLFHQYLASHGFIVTSIDNRGSYGRGKKWEDWIYKNFGKYELEDQLLWVSYLKNQTFVDPKRIGIWGWSYGGYMTLMAMLKGQGAYRVGVAVAPVTDWRYYDSIYTERYMLTPEENPEGYKNSSPVNFAKNLQGKLLIIHGTSDDNVHFQNTVAMIKALLDAKKKFSVMIYPRQSHGIRGYREDVLRRVAEFLLSNL